MRIALGVSYNGGAYQGWQSQTSGLTIQDKLEKALGKFTAQRVSTLCAGRTDAGVHGLMQVVHFDTDLARDTNSWVRGTNANLPRDIAVQWAWPVGDDFHARFSAKSRSYCYILLNRSQRPALASRRVGWYHQALDVDAMTSAAQGLVGRHDFSAFRSSECQAKTPIKMLHSFRIERYSDYILFAVHADGFLHHMVRNLVGSLVYVGSGRGDAGWIADILQSRDRRIAAPTFAPDGLYLTHIEYDSGWGLPQRQEIRSRELLAELLY